MLVLLVVNFPQSGFKVLLLQLLLKRLMNTLGLVDVNFKTQHVGRDEHLAVGQNPGTPVNIPKAFKKDYSGVRGNQPQKGTLGFDLQPSRISLRSPKKDHFKQGQEV